MHPLSAASLSLALIAPLGARAALHPAALAIDGAGEVAGVLHEFGVHARLDGGSLAFICPALGVAGDHLLATGDDRLLAAGMDGVLLSLDKGCRWQRMLGAAGVLPIVGVHADPAAPQRVVFGLGGAGGPKLAVSGDGGVTSDQLASLVLAEGRMTGLVGNGQRLLAVTVGPDGEPTLWRSEDFGDSMVPSPWPAGLFVNEPTPAAVGPDGVAWIWSGATLARLSAEGGTLTDAASVSWARAPAVVDEAGMLWFATGEAGLLRQVPGSPVAWRSVLANAPGGPLGGVDGVWAVAAHGSSVFVGLSGRVGEPWVVVTPDGGATYEPVVAAPATPLYPQTCTTRAAATCEGAAALLQAALQAPPSGAEGAELTPPPPPADGCGAGRDADWPWWVAWLVVAAGVGRRRHAP